MRISAVLILLPALAGAAAPPLRFADWPGSDFTGVTPLPNGQVLVTGTYSQTPCTNSVFGCTEALSPYFEVWNADGSTSESYVSPLGSGNTTITCAAADASGNILIAGTTNSDDFTLVNPLYSTKAPYQTTSYVAKIGPNGIVFSTFLGGQTGSEGSGPLSTPTAIAADSAGNVYIAGPTADPNFPVTGPTLGTGTPGPGAAIQPITLAFVAKLSASGSQLVYSHFLGGSAFACTGDDCVQATATTVPYAVALDANAELTIAGSTTATNFPLSTGAYQSTGSEFVARVSSNGSQLVWLTLFGTPVQPQAFPGPAPTQINSIALDSANNVWMTGSTISGIPAVSSTPGPAPPSSSTCATSSAYGFAAKLSSDGTGVLFAENLGDSCGATIAGLTLDAAGNIWITGNNKSPEFPDMSGTPPSGLDFALELNASTEAIQQIFQLLPGTANLQPSFDSNGNLLVGGSGGSVLRLNPATFYSTPAVLAVTNAATATNGPVLAPGEIVSLYGTGLLPANGTGGGSGVSEGIVSGPGSNGLYPKELGGVTVQFSSGMTLLSAPILYVGPTQINFQVPFELPASFTMTVTTPSGALPSTPMIRGSSIGIFRQPGTNYAAAMNPDGTINSASNPAPLGANMAVFVTGLGPGNATPVHGAIAPLSNDIYANEVLVAQTFPAGYLRMLYFGNAPGEINGVAQINFQLNGGNQIAVVELLGPNAGTSNYVNVYVQ